MKTYDFVRLTASYGRDFESQVNGCIWEHVEQGFHVHTMAASNGDENTFPAVSILFEADSEVAPSECPADPRDLHLVWRGKLYPDAEALAAAKATAEWEIEMPDS